MDIDEKEIISKTRRIVNAFRGKKGPLIQILHKIQSEFGYLPRLAMEIISSELKVPLSKIYGVATFYHFFSLQPKGRHIINLCKGTACYVRGADLIAKRLEEMLGVKFGETTPDGRFTLQEARCIGACALAPAMMIDEDVYGKVTPDSLKDILSKYR